MKSSKLLTIISILFLIISLVLGLQLVAERQILNKKAAVANGTIYMSLGGPSSVPVGQTLSVPLNFQTNSTPNNLGIVQMRVTLKYPNTTAFGQPTIQGNLPSSWFYPFKQVTPGTTDTTIYIEANYQLVNTAGYIPASNETFATLNFPAIAVGTLSLGFDPDPNNSKAISKSGGPIDILNSSLASATYTATGTASPTPTITTAPTSTPIPGATSTPTPIPGPTNTPGTAEPNNCNGTCGSNLNCKGGLACFSGFCRNPLDPGSTDCTVRSATPTPTKKPVSPTVKPGTKPAATPTPYPTSVPYQYPTPTPDLGLVLPTQLTPTPTPPSSPLLSRIFIVGGMWILVLLLIIWLIKKYRDSQNKEKSINDLVNRFKTPGSPPPAA